MGGGTEPSQAEEDRWTRETAGGDDRSMTQMMIRQADGLLGEAESGLWALDRQHRCG